MAYKLCDDVQIEKLNDDIVLLKDNGDAAACRACTSIHMARTVTSAASYRVSWLSSTFKSGCRLGRFSPKNVEFSSIFGVSLCTETV